MNNAANMGAFFAPQKTGFSGGSVPTHGLWPRAPLIPCASAPLRGERVHNGPQITQINTDYVRFVLLVRRTFLYARARDGNINNRKVAKVK
jgi:hypothetical protein